MKKGEEKKDRTELREKLEARGAHFTRQRAEVHEYLSQVKHHPTADEVYLAVKAEMPRISLATVYKNLEALVVCGAASKLTYGDSAARYDIRTDRHYHSRCRKCGEIRDVEPANEDTMLRLLDLPDNFSIEDFRVEVIGVCQGCNEVESKK